MVDPYDEEMRKRALSEWSSSKYALFNPRDISIHSRLQSGVTVKDQFMGRITDVDTGEFEFPDLDTLWTDAGLEKPSGYQNLSIVSIPRFTYPVISFATKLPTLDTTKKWHFGSEGGTIHQTLDVHFRAEGDGHIYTKLGGSTSEVAMLADSHLPADYDTAKNRYIVRLCRNRAEWVIGGDIVAVALFGLDESIPTWEDTEPYNLGGLVDEWISPKTSRTKLEVAKPWDEKVTFPIDKSWECIYASDGPAVPPRQHSLYNENTSTKWRSLATGGSVQTSHPVPIWGYQSKVIYVEADAAGDLAIEIYVGGGWQEYDSVTLTANELEEYTLPAEMQAPIMRCVYTPTDADTIAYGEVHLA